MAIGSCLKSNKRLINVDPTFDSGRKRRLISAVPVDTICRIATEKIMCNVAGRAAIF
jgi:hypothetical protein